MRPTPVIHGLSTAGLTCPTLSEAPRLVKSEGFGLVEFYCDHVRKVAPDDEEYAAVRREAREHGVLVAYHVHWTGEGDLAAVEPDAAAAKLRAEIGIARDLGARYVIAHMGTEGKDRRGSLDRAFAAFGAVRADLREAGLLLCVENFLEYGGVGYLGDRVSEFRELFERLPGDDIGLNLDLGHANVTRNIGEYIEAFRTKIVYTHLDDNDGSKDQHLGPGMGTVDWARWIGRLLDLGFRGPFTVEVGEKYRDRFPFVRDLVGECLSGR